MHLWTTTWKKNNKMTCAPSEDSDQPGHLPSLIRGFAVRRNTGPLTTYWEHSEDWVDAQADLILRWAHRSFCWFCHETAHLFKHAFKSCYIFHSPRIHKPHLLYKTGIQTSLVTWMLDYWAQGISVCLSAGPSLIWHHLTVQTPCGGSF